MAFLYSLGQGILSTLEARVDKGHPSHHVKDDESIWK